MCLEQELPECCGFLRSAVGAELDCDLVFMLYAIRNVSVHSFLRAYHSQFYSSNKLGIDDDLTVYVEN